jgi:hypothetical protein
MFQGRALKDMERGPVKMVANTSYTRELIQSSHTAATAKAMPRGKSVAMSGYAKRSEKSQIT